jgi:anti-sigma B factor antagonist
MGELHTSSTTVDRLDAIAVMRPHRRLLGGAETEEFRDLARTLNEEGVACLVVNLADVDWVNSAGLGAVVDAHQRFTKRGAHVTVAALGPRVLELLRITRLAEILDLQSTEEAALADARARIERPART